MFLSVKQEVGNLVNQQQFHYPVKLQNSSILTFRNAVSHFELLKYNIKSFIIEIEVFSKSWKIKYIHTMQWRLFVNVPFNNETVKREISLILCTLKRDDFGSFYYFTDGAWLKAPLYR